MSCRFCYDINCNNISRVHMICMAQSTYMVKELFIKMLIPLFMNRHPTRVRYGQYYDLNTKKKYMTKVKFTNQMKN